MKLYKLILDHSEQSKRKRVHIVSNKRSSVLDYVKSLDLDPAEYDSVSVKLIDDQVIIL